MDENRIADIFLSVAAITVIILKITNVIKISWLWLTSIIWIPFALGIVLSFGLLFFYLGIMLIDKIKEKNK